MKRLHDNSCIRAITRLGVYALSFSVVANQALPAQQSRARLVFDSVHKELSIMASLTAQTRREQSRCVTRWRSERNNGILTITLLAIGPSEYAFSDSVNLWLYHTRVPWDTTMKARICGDSLPDIHSHVADNGVLDSPSELDEQAALKHPAPFRVLLWVLPGQQMGLGLYGIHELRRP